MGPSLNGALKLLGKNDFESENERLRDMFRNEATGGTKTVASYMSASCSTECVIHHMHVKVKSLSHLHFQALSRHSYQDWLATTELASVPSATCLETFDGHARCSRNQSRGFLRARQSF